MSIEAHVSDSGGVRAPKPDPSPCARPSHHYYRPKLDWLRFGAFTMVFAAHLLPVQTGPWVEAGFPLWVATYVIVPFARAGGHGVDLFFVLSAFLITELLLRERDKTGDIHIRNFYIRRILRIWPLYFLFVLVLTPYEILFTLNPISYYVTLFVFISNWFPVFGGVFFTITGHL